MEDWKTFPIFARGGLIQNRDSLEQAIKMPGSALTLINYESAIEGGYRRIKGYEKFDSDVVPGTGAVLGCYIFNGSIIAMRDDGVYTSSGAGWTLISTSARTGAVRARAIQYSWSNSCIAVADGAPGLHPYMYDDAGVFTVLTNAPTDQTNVIEFHRALFFCDGSETVTFSSPGNATDYNPINGAGQINVGMNVTGMKVWRDELYLFNSDKIKKITGTDSSNFSVVPVTEFLGCVNPDSIQELGGDIIFLSADGIRNISGTAQINDRNLDNISNNINPYVSAIPHTNLSSIVIRGKNQYRLFHSTEERDPFTCEGVIGVNKTSGAWEWSTISGIKMTCADSGNISDGDYYIFGDWDGYVYTLESGDTFDGVGIPSAYTLPNLVFSDPAVRKTLFKLCAFLECDGDVVMTVGTDLDYQQSGVVQPPDLNIQATGGAVYFDTAEEVLFDTGPDVIFDILSTQKPCINLVGSCYAASFTFYCAEADAVPSHIIQSITIQYKDEAKR